MHIAFVNLIIEYYSPQNGGAISNWIMQQTKRLEARGHRVSILTRVGDSVTYDIGHVIPLDVRERHQISKPRRAWSKCLHAFYQWEWAYYDFYKNSVQTELKKLQPDAVVCFNDLRLPRYIRQTLPDSQVWVRLGNEVSTRQQSPYAFDQALNGYFPVSEYVRRWTESEYGLSEDRSVVILNGSDPHMFHPDPSLESTTDHQAMRVLFVGRINHDKGPDLVVDAVKSLQAQGHAIELTIVGSIWWNNDAEGGSDPYYQSLKQAMDEVKVRHLGHVERKDLPDVYREHDVVVMPSRWQEPCGQVQLEAMASGCAVVASDRGGIPEVMGEAGILVDPDKPEAVEQALQRLVVEPGLLAEQKRLSRAQALKQTWDTVTDRVEVALFKHATPNSDSTCCSNA